MTIQEFAPILKVLLDAQEAQIEMGRVTASGLGHEDHLIFTRQDYYEAQSEMIGELIRSVIHAVTKEDCE
jgi:hypothetical protein